MVDAGANGLNYAQRGKPVAKRPRFLQKEAKWTLGSRPCFTAPGNPRRFGLPHTRKAVWLGA